MSNTARAVISLPLLAAAALAQPVTVSLDAATTQLALVGDASQSLQVTLPPGPLPAIGLLGGSQIAQGAPRSAFAAWAASASDAGGSYRLQLAVSPGPAGSFGELGTSEQVVTFAGTGAVMPWRLEGSLTGDTAMLGPLFSIDVGNDGTIDWTPTTFGPIGGFGADLSAQPLEVRIVYAGSIYSPDLATATLELQLVPGDIDALRIPTGCYSFPVYEVEPLMAGGPADVRIGSTISGPTWQVLGFGAAPTALPIALTGTPLPCVVLPTPDWVWPTPTVFVEVPASLRPLSFYAQSIRLNSGQLRPSDTFLITAW